MTGTLPDLSDAATGLVHLGGGRWYDPTLGRPLQPNLADGPPTLLPQALNRYAAVFDNHKQRQKITKNMSTNDVWIVFGLVITGIILTAIGVWMRLGKNRGRNGNLIT